MEAEDESGVLQQLKASLQAELQQQDDHESSKTGEEHDPYGSDFEEEEVVRYRGLAPIGAIVLSPSHENRFVCAK